MYWFTSIHFYLKMAMCGIFHVTKVYAYCYIEVYKWKKINLALTGFWTNVCLFHSVVKNIVYHVVVACSTLSMQ